MKAVLVLQSASLCVHVSLCHTVFLTLHTSLFPPPPLPTSTPPPHYRLLLLSCRYCDTSCQALHWDGGRGEHAAAVGMVGDEIQVGGREQRRGRGRGIRAAPHQRDCARLGRETGMFRSGMRTPTMVGRQSLFVSEERLLGLVGEEERWGGRAEEATADVTHASAFGTAPHTPPAATPATAAASTDNPSRARQHLDIRLHPFSHGSSLEISNASHHITTPQQQRHQQLNEDVVSTGSSRGTEKRIAQLLRDTQQLQAHPQQPYLKHPHLHDVQSQQLQPQLQQHPHAEELHLQSPSQPVCGSGARSARGVRAMNAAAQSVRSVSVGRTGDGAKGALPMLEFGRPGGPHTPLSYSSYAYESTDGGARSKGALDREPRARGKRADPSTSRDRSRDLRRQTTERNKTKNKKNTNKKNTARTVGGLSMVERESPTINKTAHTNAAPPPNACGFGSVLGLYAHLDPDDATHLGRRNRARRNQQQQQQQEQGATQESRVGAVGGAVLIGCDDDYVDFDGESDDGGGNGGGGGRGGVVFGLVYCP